MQDQRPTIGLSELACVSSNPLSTHWALCVCLKAKLASHMATLPVNKGCQ